MAGALATIAANLSPGEWTKTNSDEENGCSFDKWIRKYERWESIACGALNHTPAQRWNLLLATCGSDLEDIIVHQAKVTIKHVPRIDPVEPQEEIPFLAANPDTGAGGQAFRAGVARVIGRPEVQPTEWEAGIQMIRDSITKYSNDVICRKKLMFDMPAGNYSDWRKWLRKAQVEKLSGMGIPVF